jgi:hypothetical protein
MALDLREVAKIEHVDHAEHSHSAFIIFQLPPIWPIKATQFVCEACIILPGALVGCFGSNLTEEET